ncbi:LOW QUALITY PROTEIN: hypothetical protein CVT25_015900 [Psilocybe cyanescens]|uniref:Uncharacterized protein n=1 Tax=Psilocybe cyanescens TaxID=93625 RepID=A0A409WSC7_PSICY|nr:LOW QUALITY PROTEIN: hypothetical protein CVT25_015900 [Psilocybe cyanescens]
MYNSHDDNLHFSPSALLPNRQTIILHPDRRSIAYHETAHGPMVRPELTAAQRRASRKGVALVTCLTATLIIGSLLAMTVVLLSYLCAVHQCQVSRHSIISTAPLGKVLTITQITSHISPVSIPIIMGLFSYLLSVEWLRSSKAKKGQNRPTPMQLGLLMSMCNGSNLRSLFTSVKYVALKRPTDKAAKVSPAPMLWQSIFILGSLLAISYIAAGADAWMHASSTSVIIPSNSAYAASSALPSLGREINATMCQAASAFNTDAIGHIIAASCGMLNTGSGGSGNQLAEGIRVLSNSSNLHKVAFTDDQTAILIPSSLPSNITYEARTMGVRSQCTTITKACVFEVADGSFLDYGPNAFLNLDCSRAGIKYQNGTQLSPLCALDNQGLCTDGTSISSNPFTAGEVATSFAYLNPGQPLDTCKHNCSSFIQFNLLTLISCRRWFVHRNKGAWNVIFCNVTALDVIYTYASSRFIIQSATPKSVNDTQHMMAAGFDGQTTAISQAVDGAGLDVSTTYEQAYSVELSRQMLARGAFLYEPTDVIRMQSENNIVGSNLRTPPLTLFIAALLLFACQILWITLRITIATWNIKFVGLAALYLNNPLAVVQTLYGRTDPELTWNDDVAKRFGTETDSDRLRVGPVHNEFGPVPELTAAQMHASRKGVTLTTCLTATLIVGSVLGMSAVLLSYLCAVHQCQVLHSIISTAPLGKVLTITQVMSHISPISIPIIMGLFSYLFSAEWLRSSGVNEGRNRPTPMQYVHRIDSSVLESGRADYDNHDGRLGLLMSMCNSPSIWSFFTSVKYVALNRPTDIGGKVTPAPMLRQSIFVLGSLLAISYIAAGADAWLHASSTSIIILSNSAYVVSSVLPSLGRKINVTMCQAASAFNTDAIGHITAASCGILNTGSGGSGTQLAEGIRVLSNSSNLHKVAFADDQTAIMIPPRFPSNITYEARTVGVRSQCTTITKVCIFEVADGSFLDYGPDALLNLDCSRAGIKYQNGTQLSPLCALDGPLYQRNEYFFQVSADDRLMHRIKPKTICSPFTAGEVATSFAYLNPNRPLDTFVGNTGWFVHRSEGAWNVIFCNVTALDVIYTYASSRYIVQSATPKSVDDTQHVMAAGFDGQTTAISQAVDGAGLDTSTTYEQAYSVELSRQMLARGALLYEPADVIRIQSENNIVGSNLRTLPLALFISVLLVFACQIIWITLRIIIAARNVKFVSLAALYLNNPLAVVQTLYGRTDPELTWDDDVAKRFGTETDFDRLRVGPVHNEFGSVFAVTRG